MTASDKDASRAKIKVIETANTPSTPYPCRKKSMSIGLGLASEVDLVRGAFEMVVFGREKAIRIANAVGTARTTNAWFGYQEQREKKVQGTKAAQIF